MDYLHFFKVVFKGLSFVVGLVLIYLPGEEDAYKLLRHIMYGCNMRRYYMPDMVALQEAMYQLSRLLSELEKDLYQFLEYHGVTPVLYLTPWFLTIFASNFPLNFAVRVLGKAEALASAFLYTLYIFSDINEVKIFLRLTLVMIASITLVKGFFLIFNF